MERIVFRGLLWCMVLFFSTNILFAQEERPNIAVLELEGKNISAQDASVLTDKLRGELINTGVFQVIERGVMDQVLKEQGFQQSGCTSDDCAVEIGQLIGVNQMVAGSIGRIEDIYLVSIRLIDVQSGKIIKMVQKDIPGTLTIVLREGIPQCAGQLAGIAPPAAQPPLVSQPQVLPEKTEEKPEKLQKPANEQIKPRFSLTAGYVMSNGWYNRGQSTDITSGIVVSENDYGHSVPTHGGMIAAGIKMKRSRLNLECTFARGVWEDIEDLTSSNFASMTTVTFGGGLVWYLEIWRIADFVTIAPAIGVGFWNTADDFGNNVDLQSYQFGALFLRLKLGPDRINWFVDIGELVGTQPEMTLQDLPEHSSFSFYRIPPLLQVRSGLEITF